MTTPAPGWYPDTTGLPVQRYWDGQQWTPATAPIAGDTGERFTVNYGFALLAALSLAATLFFGVPLLFTGAGSFGMMWLLWGGMWTAIWSAFAMQRTWRR
ncbi:DUF2510 domain-containing protein [Mycolicibacterium fortuitum]|uniref:DUF2510 domain-containing protein n=1 Tax=Mycolicibacterium fortuitum TaxID=1766 RepID=UPI0022BA702E|nr:DUF2510 domain-containing protein [Mycolicibacterium fortuitum]WAY18447.1 DUF2510 domain-containing protein [Mycolicibacterium fortuitum]